MTHGLGLFLGRGWPLEVPLLLYNAAPGIGLQWDVASNFPTSFNVASFNVASEGCQSLLTSLCISHKNNLFLHYCWIGMSMGRRAWGSLYYYPASAPENPLKFNHS